MSRPSAGLFAAALGIAIALAGSRAHAAGFGTAPPAVASFDSGSLHVDTYGHGPQTLIFIAGLASGPWVWYGTIDRLMQGDGADRYTVYALTLPGFDGRPASPKTPLFSSVAADFWAMLDAKNITKPVIVGHSLGGTLAIALAEEHPERLRGILAVDGLPVFPLLAAATPQQRTAAAAQMSAMYAALTPERELAAEKQYMSAIGTVHSELVEPTAQLEARSDPKAMAQWMQEDLDADLRPGLSKIAVPFTEIMPYDAADNAAPPRNFTQAQTLAFYQSLVAGAPNVTVVPIAPSRHFAMLDRPDAFYAALTQFLAKLP